MAKSLEEQWATVLRSQSAKADLDRVEPLLDARKERLITQAIASYRALDPTKKLTPRGALLVIAALAEVEELRQALCNEISDGRKAVKVLNERKI